MSNKAVSHIAYQEHLSPAVMKRVIGSAAGRQGDRARATGITRCEARQL
jgi:hypothetical protein